MEPNSSVRTQTPSPEAHSEPLDDGGTPSMGQLVRATIRQYRKQLRSNEPVVRAGTDPDGVHDMRTATRALRAALDVCVELRMIEPRAARTVDRRLRHLARALGRVRDLDVLAESCVTYVSEHAGTSSELDAWIAHLARRHRIARRRLLRTLDSRKYRRLLRALRRLGKHSSRATGQSLSVRSQASTAIWQRYESVLAHAFDASEEEETPEMLHALRIACKQLRYTTDLFASVLGSEYEVVRETLVRCQKVLGAAHDAAAGLAALRGYRSKHTAELKLDAYIGTQTLQLQMLQAEAVACRAELAGDPLRRALAAAIAGA